MMMGERSVVVSLRETVMRVNALLIVRVLGRRGIVLMRVAVVVRRLSIVDVVTHGGRDIVVVLVGETGELQDVLLQVMGMVEHGPGEPVGRMLDLEGVLEAVEDGDRHLRRQRHAQPHAEQGDVAFGDCKPLTDHNSSRGRVWNFRPV